MTAVAVVTPRSASNSAVMVGADMCPSLFVACGPLPDMRFLLWRPSVVVRRRRASVGDRSSIEALGVQFPVSGKRCVPGATTEDRPFAGHVRRWGRGPVRRVPHERGDRPGMIPGAVPSTWLAAQAEPLDERAVSGDVRLRQVVQQPATPADQQEQAPPAVVVVLVHLEVL